MHKSSLKTIAFSRLAGLFCLLGILLCGCQNQRLTKVTIANRVFYLESAKTSAEKIKGLSGRGKLNADRGMIFLYDKPEVQSFWMKDTLIPLQIIFINGCKIVDVQEMPVEDDPTNPQKKYISSSMTDKVIEINSRSVSENSVGENIQELCD